MCLDESILGVARCKVSGIARGFSATCRCALLFAALRNGYLLQGALDEKLVDELLGVDQVCKGPHTGSKTVLTSLPWSLSRTSALRRSCSSVRVATPSFSDTSTSAVVDSLVLGSVFIGVLQPFSATVA